MNAATILHEAEVELAEAVAYYEERCPGLGLDFAAEVEASVATVCDFPERWPVRSDGTHRYLTTRFPYVVVYLYLNHHVWIIAIAHCKRKPGYWTKQTQTPYI
jgi:plasmid stabilization system protein ParE